MAKVEIRITAESPISLGTTKAYGGTLIESGRYITGGHLRGALGSIRQYVAASEQHEIDLLLGAPGQPGINFPNCYPIKSRDGSAYPLPLTAHSCKRASGFKVDDKDNHGVADTLLLQLSYDRVGAEGGKWPIPLPFKFRCDECGNRTEPYEKVAERWGVGKYTMSEVSLHRQTRVAINRKRLTAEQSQLYSVQAIDEGSIFVGAADVEDGRIELFSKWLEKIERIGGRTSRGFGRVSVNASGSTVHENVRGRLADFNDKYSEIEDSLCGIAGEVTVADKHRLFSVNLRSDALLRTLEGLPSLEFNEEMLGDALSRIVNGQQPDELLKRLNLRLIAQYTQPTQVSGWQTAWRLPKEVLLASRMGGLYVFSANAIDADDYDSLIAMLEKLQAEGIGEMREDGYGQITICDQFHLEVEPV
jgi:CRISPR-associated protein Csx10